MLCRFSKIATIIINHRYRLFIIVDYSLLLFVTMIIFILQTNSYGPFYSQNFLLSNTKIFSFFILIASLFPKFFKHTYTHTSNDFFASKNKCRFKDQKNEIHYKYEIIHPLKPSSSSSSSNNSINNINDITLYSLKINDN